MHAFIRLLGLTICMAIIAPPLHAQVVRGRIVDESTRARLSGVEVALLDNIGRTRARVITDTTGLFEVHPPRAGGYRLRVSSIGYLTFTSDLLELAPGERVQVSVQLSTLAIPLTPLVITARARNRLGEFDKRRANHAGGYFLTQEDLDRRVIQATSFLSVVPGVTLRDLPFNTQVILLPDPPRGTCVANVYVDGSPAVLDARASVDDVLQPDWVGGIEVYTHAAFAPIEYRRGNSCGVVLFWTREPPIGGNWNWLKIATVSGLVAFMALLVR